MYIGTIKGWVSTNEEIGASEFERLVRKLFRVIVNNDKSVCRVSFRRDLIQSEESDEIKRYVDVLIQFKDSQVLTYEFFNKFEGYLEYCIEKSGVKGKINHPRCMALYKITLPAFEHLQEWDLLATREKYDTGAIYFNIPGLPTEQAVSKLSNLGYELIVPKPFSEKEKTTWTAYNKNEQYIHIGTKPSILLVKYFDGEFNCQDEKQLGGVFKQIKEIASDERLLEKFLKSKEGEDLKDRADKYGINTDYELERCTFYNPGWNTPRLRIVQFIKGEDGNLRLEADLGSASKIFTLDELPIGKYENIV